MNPDQPIDAPFGKRSIRSSGFLTLSKNEALPTRLLSVSEAAMILRKSIDCNLGPILSSCLM